MDDRPPPAWLCMSSWGRVSRDPVARGPAPPPAPRTGPARPSASGRSRLGRSPGVSQSAAASRPAPPSAPRASHPLTPCLSPRRLGAQSHFAKVSFRTGERDRGGVAGVQKALGTAVHVNAGAGGARARNACLGSG